MLFLRQLQHLLPSGQAWSITIEKTLRKFFVGLARSNESARDFADLAYEDLFPSTTREPERWESQFGLVPASTEQARRQQIDAAWKSTGGQSPRYIQDRVWDAGFTNVYLHEWWYYTGPTRNTRNPRDYTDDPLLGTVQCGEAVAICGEQLAVCNNFLANDTHYLVNVDLSHGAPPPVPEDPARWPYFIYFCGQTFGTYADVPLARRAEFERLILKICPTNLWLVTLINWV